MSVNAFNRAGKKDGAARSLIAAIRRERPDLKYKSFIKPEYGNRSHVLIAGDEVFKAPMVEAHIAELDREYDNLSHLQGKGLLVPEITCQGADAVFYGMKRAHGMPLEKLFGSLSPAEEAALATDIGAFIAGMDAAFADIVVKTPKEEGYNINPQAILERLESKGAYKNLGAHYDFCRSEIEAYYERMESRRVIACHTDLHPENLLVYPDTKRLACVTDFGAVSHNLAEDALGSLNGWGKPPFLAKVWAEYTRIRTHVDPCEFYASRLVSLTLFLDGEIGRQGKEKLQFILGGLKSKPTSRTNKPGGLAC